MNGWRAGIAGLIVMITCLTGQTVAAQTVESLVMPGEVIRGHAEVEAECESCHKPFNRSEQNVLCLDCHEDVAADTTNSRGFHGKSPDVDGSPCASCHTDHEGRNADILGLDEAAFDHLFTDFELLGHHGEAKCSGCHLPDVKRRDAPGVCVDCHLEDDAHDGNLGSECADCHNPRDWTNTTFDHDTTDFPLIGNHGEVECLSCHADQTHQNTPTTCYGCHAEDDVHEGRSGEQCDTCHNPKSWTDTSFDHALNTDFPLDGKHAQLSCNDCHTEDPFDDVMDMSCVSCHLEDDEHAGNNGTECEACHTSTGWDQNIFDHDRSTDFMLRASHREAACADCHVEPIFEVKPGNNCASCHLDDDAHGGQLGDQCSDCHDESKWVDRPFFDHSFAQFPLLGAHANVECIECHESRLFHDADNNCVSCHLEDDSHDGVFDGACGSCHNPVAWDLWLFDHNVQTDFLLHGAHVDVACGDCHRSSLTSMQKTGGRCADCHRSDDVHHGEFGPDCGRCHSDTSFKDVRSLQ